VSFRKPPPAEEARCRDVEEYDDAVTRIEADRVEQARPLEDQGAAPTVR
jgi:hypothetical protein